MKELQIQEVIQYPVAVYGTLRRGGRNHHYMKNAKYLGQGLSCSKFSLYIDFLPRLVPFVSQAQALSQIVVELYQVDIPTLIALDELEEHPHWYLRELTSIQLEQNRHQAWLYFFPPLEDLSEKHQLIDSGDFAQVPGSGLI